jgi:hypothetical protein
MQPDTSSEPVSPAQMPSAPPDRRSLATLVLIWLAWAIILLSFQSLVRARFEIGRPDYAVFWTPGETEADSQNNKPYLLDPVMNEQVAWDSEFYISIATTGYDDPTLRTVRLPDGSSLPLNYAFFPLYPFLMRVVAAPLGLLDLSPVGAATIAGVLIALIGTLAALIALYDITSPTLGDTGGIRTAFYMLIFPTGFFLAQVYTEGLFVGLAFGCLALLRRNQWVAAAILAAAATWTRGVGIALLLPMALALFHEVMAARRTSSNQRATWQPVIIHAALTLAPIAAYLIWRYFLGTQFHAVEDAFFSRGAFLIGRSFSAWHDSLNVFGSDNTQSAVYYGLEFAAMLLALIASLAVLRREPGLALFSLAVLLISVTSGVPQSMIRYMLPIPAIYIFLSTLGQNEAFDRVWSLTSILLMGLLAMLFSFDMWVA